MRTFNLVMDLADGAVFAQGKDGRRYSMAEVEAAEVAARRGDPGGTATLIAVDAGLDDHGRPLSQEAMRRQLAQMLDDCPDCRAARGQPQRRFFRGRR